jgi:hypothetical protein
MNARIPTLERVAVRQLDVSGAGRRAGRGAVVRRPPLPRPLLHQPPLVVRLRLDPSPTPLGQLVPRLGLLLDGQEPEQLGTNVPRQVGRLAVPGRERRPAATHREPLRVNDEMPRMRGIGRTTW